MASASSRMRLLLLVLLGGTLSVSSPSSPICEDSLDDGVTPPFNANDVPCLLGCGKALTVASGSLLPGDVITSTIPYCQLDCVVSTAGSAQSLAAPACYNLCHNVNQATPENTGWCMYWCVAGYSDLVASTACVPSLAYAPVTTVVGGLTETYERKTCPNEALLYASGRLGELVCHRDHSAQDDDDDDFNEKVYQQPRRVRAEVDVCAINNGRHYDYYNHFHLHLHCEQPLYVGRLTNHYCQLESRK